MSLRNRFPENFLDGCAYDIESCSKNLSNSFLCRFAISVALCFLRLGQVDQLWTLLSEIPMKFLTLVTCFCMSGNSALALIHIAAAQLLGFSL